MKRNFPNPDSNFCGDDYLTHNYVVPSHFNAYIQSVEDSPRLLCLGFESRGRVTSTENAELNEDCYVFNHGAERTNQPGQVDQYVLPFGRVENDLSPSAHSLSWPCW